MLAQWVVRSFFVLRGEVEEGGCGGHGSMLLGIVGPEVEEGLRSGNTGSVCSWVMEFNSRCEKRAGALHVYVCWRRVI